MNTKCLVFHGFLFAKKKQISHNGEKDFAQLKTVVKIQTEKAVFFLFRQKKWFFCGIVFNVDSSFSSFLVSHQIC